MTDTLTFGMRLISVFFDRRPFQKGGLRRHSLEGSSSVSGIKPLYLLQQTGMPKRVYQGCFFFFELNRDTVFALGFKSVRNEKGEKNLLLLCQLSSQP